MGIAASILIAGIVLALALVVQYRYLMRKASRRAQRFAAMFENTSELMCVYDTEGRIRRANTAALQRLGFGAEVVGKHYDLHIAEPYRPIASVGFRQALQGKATEMDGDFIDSRGNPVPVSVTLSPIIVDGDVVGVLGAARDMTEQRLVEEDLQRSAERFRSLYERSSHPIGAIDTNGTITHVNVALERLSGYRTEELVGHPVTMLMPEHRRDGAMERFFAHTSAEQSNYEGFILCSNGQELPVDVDISPIRVGGELEGFYIRLKDLSHEKAILRAITQKDDRMRLLYRVAAAAQSADVQIEEALSLGAKAMGMPYGFIVRYEGDTLEVQHRHGPSDIFPVGFSKPIARSISHALRASPRALAMDDLRIEPYASDLAKAGLPWKSYIGSRISLDGEIYGALFFCDRVVRPVTFDDADLDFIDLLASIVGGAVARSVRDNALHRQAFYDALTGAVNRRLFEEHVAKAIARSKRLSSTLAVHYVDLNRFKPINDQYGHEAGDEVLKEVVRRLVRTVRDHDVVARIGGDEFVVLQADITNDSSAQLIAQRLHDALKPPMHIADGIDVQVGCSIGTAIFPKDGGTLGDLLKSADAAMYVEKRQSNPSMRPA